jgi:branched-chain amino acid transport system permease protein
MSLASGMGLPLAHHASYQGWWTIKLSQLAPVLPYLLMVVTLILRPRGLLGTRSE